MLDLQHFFTAPHFLSNTARNYDPLQMGNSVSYPESQGFNWTDADVVLVGCALNPSADAVHPADAVRAALYAMYQWHPSIRVYDAGNIQQGARQRDTVVALRTVLAEIEDAGKIALVIGDAHALTLQQYEVFKRREQLIDAAIVDMLIDLDETEETTDQSFLMELLTGTPNFIRNYTHIGFQSYYVHPRMLETLDKLRFDFLRLGKVREQMEEAEPALRSANLFSFDLSAVRYPDAISNIDGSPNGFTGDEACMLTRYAGMSPKLSSMGIYGYNPAHDPHKMTARLVAQMIWYFLDGLLIRQAEADLSKDNEFVSFHITTEDMETVFMKSKRTGRWWMKVTDGHFIPCLHTDYITASQNEIPERWLREQERLS